MRRIVALIFRFFQSKLAKTRCGALFGTGIGVAGFVGQDQSGRIGSNFILRPTARLASRHIPEAPRAILEARSNMPPGERTHVTLLASRRVRLYHAALLINGYSFVLKRSSAELRPDEFH